MASCFVLVTDIHNSGEGPAEKVVRDYKEQSWVELSFKAIKEQEFVGATYVKKPERLETSAYVLLLAALNLLTVCPGGVQFCSMNPEIYLELEGA
jgi:transposase